MSEGAAADDTPPLPSAAMVSIGPADNIYMMGILEPPRLAGLVGGLPGYDVLRLIGSGGMGMVFEARDVATEARVAIKLLRPELVQSSEAVHRFLIEAGHMHKLSHPHILPVTHVFSRIEGPYYVM